MDGIGHVQLRRSLDAGEGTETLDFDQVPALDLRVVAFASIHGEGPLAQALHEQGATASRAPDAQMPPREKRIHQRRAGFIATRALAHERKARLSASVPVAAEAGGLRSGQQQLATARGLLAPPEDDQGEPSDAASRVQHRTVLDVESGPARIQGGVSHATTLAGVHIIE
jgi:hypothetical protein